VSGVPLRGCDFPNFSQESAGHVLAFFGGNQAHAVLLGYSTGRLVDAGLWRAQNLEVQNIKTLKHGSIFPEGNACVSVKKQGYQQSDISDQEARTNDNAEAVGTRRFAEERRGTVTQKSQR